MKMFGKCPFFFSKLSQTQAKNSRGYENIQRSAGDGSCLQVHFTGLHSHHGMIQRDPCMGALLVGFLCYMLQKKDNMACVLHYCQDKIQKRQSKGGFKDTTYKY